MNFSSHFSATLVLGCAAACAAGCSQMMTADGESKSTSKAEKTVAVKTVTVVQEDVRQTSVQPATVQAYFAAAIQARVHGYVSDVKAEIGDAVHQGDVLAVISAPEMEKQRLVAAAQLAKQQAEEERATAGIALATANVQAAEALATEANSQLQQVEASLAAAQAEFVRTEDLVKRGSIQPRLLDEVRKRRDSEAAGKALATSAIETAAANVRVAKSKAAAAAADLKATMAETEVRRAQLAEIDELIRYTTVTAPFDGVVTERSVSPGDLVSDRHNGKSLFIVSQLDKVRIQIPVPEHDAPYVSHGDSIRLLFPSFPAEDAMIVTVTRLTGSLDPSTRTMLVEAEVENTDGRLLPGMFGQAVISLGTKVAANILPARSVRFSEDGRAYVYVVSEDTVSVASVTTGIDDGNSIEITSGLQHGQNVIDAHLQRFTDGQRVRVLQ